jgi:uncharacterized protein YgiM (DUF1202 family)
MKISKKIFRNNYSNGVLTIGLLFLFLIQLRSYGQSGYFKAVIKDPDGYTNVRAGKSVNTSVVAIVYENEHFMAQPTSESNWYKVVLYSGIQGYMHNSRIHFVEERNSSVENKQPMSAAEMGLILNLLGSGAQSEQLKCKRPGCGKVFCCGWEVRSDGECREACITGIKCRGDYCSKYCCE